MTIKELKAVMMKPISNMPDSIGKKAHIESLHQKNSLKKDRSL